jgi:hypothetical protein
MLMQFVEIFRTFRENYIANRKDKKGKDTFINELHEAYKGLTMNMTKT